MPKALSTFLLIPAPWVLGLACLSGVFWLPDRDAKTVCEVVVWAAEKISLPVVSPSFCSSSPLLAHGALGLMGLLAFFVGAFRDYAKFFPRKFSIDVFFDEDGIARTLQSLGDITPLNVDADWRQKRRAYFDDLNVRLANENVKFKFDLGGSTIGKGTGRFVAKLNTNWSFQLYKIVKASGDIALETKLPGGTTSQQLETEYELLPSASSYIQPTAYDLYVRRSALIMPEFRQMIKLEQGQGTRFDHVLVTATRVRIWPRIDLGRTVYLAKGASGGNIPIGFAVYTPITDDDD